MASRVAMNAMGNFPVKTVNASEGTLTRYTSSVSPRGGVNEGAAVYQTPIVKGDLVVLVAEDTANRVTVAKAVPGDNTMDAVVGMAVASPQGIDNTTASGATPVDSLQRKVDVAFFGIGIIELEANGAITPGHGIEFSESEQNIIGDSGSAADNGDMMALSLGADGVLVAVLVGYSGYQPAD